MTIIYFLLCILQPICLPIPEMVTVLWGSVTIGATKSFILGVAGSLIGIVSMYWISRKCGNWLIKKMKWEQKVTRFQNYIKKYQIYIVGILFIVPILPDEIICIGSNLVGIKFSLFMCIAIIGKIISVGMIAYSEEIGALLGLSNIELIGLELVILFMIARIYQIREKKEENKENNRVIEKNI